MGLILAGIIGGVIFWFIARVVYVWTQNSESAIGSLCITFAVVCLLFGVLSGIFAPVNGYEEQSKKESTIELVGLRVGESKGYVFASGTNSYTYYVEVDSPDVSNSQKAYESETVSSNNVIIVEDDNYMKAKLVTYVRDGKKTFWTFAVGAKQYEYVFYVPIDTTSRDALLG